MHKYTGLDLDVRGFLDDITRKGANPEPSVSELRRHAREIEGAGMAPAEVRLEQRAITSRGNDEIRLTIVRPRDAEQPLPALIYLHGGGWVFGDEVTHEWVIKELAVATRSAVVFVRYSLSPEAQHPLALSEALAVLEWISTQGPAAGLLPDRIGIAGDSAGANMAAVASILAASRGLSAPCAQVLFYPTTDAEHSYPSMSQYASGYYLTGDALRWSARQHFPRWVRADDFTVSPIRATDAQLALSPPTLVISAEFDPLRDEGEAFARRLIDVGVPVVATRYLGTIHAFLTIRALARTPAPRAAIAQAAATLIPVLHDRLSPASRGSVRAD